MVRLSVFILILLPILEGHAGRPNKYETSGITAIDQSASVTRSAPGGRAVSPPEPGGRKWADSGRRGAPSGTSENHYDAGTQDQNITLIGADAIRLAETEAIFAVWNKEQVEAESRKNLADYQQQLTKKQEAEKVNFADKEIQADFYEERFKEDRADKIAAAQAAERKKKGLGGFGGFFQSIAGAMFGGGLDFRAAMSQVATQQVTGEVHRAVAKAIGLPTGFLTGLANGLPPHEAAYQHLENEAF